MNLAAGAAKPLRAVALSVLGLLTLAGRAGEFSDEFDRQRFKDALKREIAFRVAAIQVAWGAEPLCDDTTEIEPFVLWSADSVRSGLSSHQRTLLKQATGMDEKWRVVWVDESAPDELKLRTVVTAVNGRALPAVGAKVELGAVFRGGSTVAVDDRAFWEVMHKAREEANADSKMTVTLEGGHKIKVPTQTGCAGSVMATAFDNEPANFLRQEGRRVKLPGNALNEARTTDEFRWLAAFGIYFVASERSITGQRQADSMSSAFTVGKVLTLAVPGAGTVLSAMEYKAEREIMVEGIVGHADLFADEVVMALGGHADAGLKLSDRLKRAGVNADVLPMTDFRRSNVELHVKRLAEIERAREAAELKAEAAAAAAAAGSGASAPTPWAPKPASVAASAASPAKAAAPTSAPASAASAAR